MKKFSYLAATVAAAIACSTASAGVVTFESLTPTVYDGGEQFANGYEKFTVLGAGFSGAVEDGSDPVACAIVTCPVGNFSKYFAAFNDGGLSFMRSDTNIKLVSLDFGFVLPAPTVVSGPVGQLQITGTKADGSTLQVAKDFSQQNGMGNYEFSHWDIGGIFADTRFASVAFNACLYAGGVCSTDPNTTQNQAQFAVDNLDYVPEPASMALVAISLGGMFAVRRRKSV